MPVSNFNSRTTLVLLLLLSLWPLSCRRQSAFFFVRNKGAVMPVKVRGNVDSPVYVLLLPGGPSGDGLVYSTAFPMFEDYIEPRYNMVYYDQRGAGNCQGVYDTTTLRLAQLVEDLDQVVEVLRAGREDSRVFLLGYSFGGALGMSYLQYPEYRAKIDGFISVAGAFDRAKQGERQDQLVSYLLERWVEEGDIPGYEYLRDGFTCADRIDVEACRRDSAMVREKVAEGLERVEAYNQFPVRAGAVFRLLEFAFFSQSNPIQSGINEGQTGRFYHRDFDSLLLSERAGEIDIPCLFINGRYDTNVPFFEAQVMYDRIGTPVEDKAVLFLEASGHLPMLTEPDKLAEAIIRFIENDRTKR